jgi:site-specific DNA-methyltransferase (adenine-specific)
MVCGIEDAGFEIRDEICWIHPQGIPKNQDAAKAIDKLYFEEWLVEVGVDFDAKEVRDLISDFTQGRRDSELLKVLEQKYGLPSWGVPAEQADGTVVPAHPRAKLHAGRGTALKAVWEPIVMARKPFVGTLAKHLLRLSTGALNIDAARIPTTDEYVVNRFVSGAKPFGGAKGEAYASVTPSGGRYPANLLTSPGDIEDRSAVHIEAESMTSKVRTQETSDLHDGVLGSYTRFFVIPKPSSKEKDTGLGRPNSHPTVKPISLMRYLVKMVVPKGGVCLDPFMGSGTTGVACVDEERSFIGIELTDKHFEEATLRVQFQLDNHDRSMESVLALLPEE